VAYVVLASAIVIEVLATTLLKVSHGFTRVLPTTASLIGYGMSLFLLSRIVRTLPVGLVYAVWAGTGTFAIFAISVAFFHEPASLPKVLGVAMIVAGVVLVNVGGPR
jgi:small multidrug resistance pump